MENIYRVTYDGIGIYEAYKRLVSKEEWLLFLQNENNKWLSKPSYYDDSFKSYFTEKGFKQFKELILPIMLEKLSEEKVNIQTFKMYEDTYQIITNTKQTE